MEWVPALNTALIVVSGLFLAVGYGFIRRKRVAAHRRCMVTATVFAALFLVVYVWRAVVLGPKPFPGQGLAYAGYLSVLVPHLLAAASVGPLALVTLRRAVRGNYPAHRRIARITLPLWAFAASSGWVIYAMLYLINWG
jgi:putative membrane protein